ncbi:hypothetical protein ABZP36_019075 [Zizania latifolia]
MKVLIAQEMAKEGDTNQKTTSVVARLMGLDDVALPQLVQHSNMRRFPDGHLSSTLARINSQMSFDKHTGFVENVEYKDVYEVGYQPQSSEHLGNEFPQRRRPHEDHDKKRMDLVRQKFVEAKQLASHENLLQSKQFNDALEVLNSNKDLFLKFLEEPNSLFGMQSGEFHYAPASPQMKRITVLKPTRSLEIKGEKAIKRHQDQTVNGTRVERSNIHRKPNSCHAKAERPPQHTRIVVLKPSLAITSLGHFQKNGHDDLDDSEAPVISRHSSDEINWSLQDMCHQHDESFRGCVLPNMFTKDRVHYEYAEEGSSFSDSEVGSPTSRHSWDYIYRIGNPYFGSSLSHASCSPESLVTREANKHTSDRWPIVSSNEVSQEKVLVRRSLSTLGDLLAMSDMKTKEDAEQVVTGTSNQLCSNEPRLVVPSKCYIDGENRESSLKKISRSKSVPVSSAAFDSLRLDAGCSNPQDEEPTSPKEEIKPKNGKSSLKGKISSFFLKHKKAGKDKLAPSPLGALGSRVPLASNESIVNSDVSQPECTSLQDNVASENLEKLGIAPTVVPGNEPKATSSSSKSPISLEKALLFEIRNSHLDQPSPTSVLAASFEEPPNSSESPIVTKQEPLSRSLPIGSIARTLSWDDSSQEATLCSSKGDSHEQEQHEFIEKILSSAGFGDEKTSDIFVRWHTLDFPLGTALYDQFLERKVEDAKGRERRSNQKLLIDSVSAALLDIGQSKLWGAYPCTEPQRVATGDVLVVDEVWRLVKGWLSDDDGEEHMVNAMDNVGLAADWVVGREIQGRAWPETRRLEVDEISKEICGEVMAELVGEAFSGLA